MKTLIIALLIVCAIPCFAQDATAADSLQSQITYRLDLAKYYHGKQEYEWVLTALRDSLLEQVNNDSIRFLRGLAYGELGNWNRAVEELSVILVHSSSDSMKATVKPLYCRYVQNLDPATAIEKLTQLLQNEHHLDGDLMLTIGAIYEQNQLYAEANDVYITLLADTADVDTTEVMLKLVSNDKILEDYTAMWNHLQPLASRVDSTIAPHIALLQAEAAYGLQRHSAAEELLLALYKSQPEGIDTQAVRLLLAQNYQAMGQKVLAWYFLSEMAQYSSKAELYFLHNEIKELKQQIASDSLPEDQFRHLQFINPLFDLPATR